MTSGVVLREGRDDDAAGFIALIGDCWAEYPGCILDVDGEERELRALASYFQRHGGALWAAEQAGRVIGMVGARPLAEAGGWEICRLYVAAEARGAGLAQPLLDTAETHARASGAERLVLWTDTRFTRAHAFYEKRSYLRQGAIRVLDDLSKSLEFRYAKPARGVVVEALDAASAVSAERRLAEILAACVNGGAAVTFLAPLSMERARAFWKKIAADVALGSRVLLGAWLDGVLVGTVQLDLGTPENQPHRADLSKLLVAPGARCAGIGRALMERAQQAAHAHGRRLITLDTRVGDFGEALYRSLGYSEAGRIPGYALSADRTPHATVIFWKALA